MTEPAPAPQQGDFIWLSLDPRTRREQSGDRPALVLSLKAFSSVTGFALVAPITSRVRGWPFEVVLPEGLEISGAILVDQARSVDLVARRYRPAGAAPALVLADALAKLDAILGARRAP